MSKNINLKTINEVDARWHLLLNPDRGDMNTEKLIMKAKMKPKLITYKCKCTVMWTPGTPKNFNCHDHKRPVESYTTWCEVCGKEIVDKPQSGYRRKFCRECFRIRHLAKVNEGYKEGKYKYPSKESQKTRVIQESEPVRQRRLVVECLDEVGAKYRPVRTI